MEIKATEIVLVSPSELVPYSKNANKHPPEQIDRLIKLIEYQGFRDPLIIQKGTNIVVAGHGRLAAANKMGLEKIPVTYQEFESEAQMYSFMVSHNAIADWAELDLSSINTEMLDLGPDFHTDLLGIEHFNVDAPMFEPGTEEDQGKLDEKKPLITQCPNCGECFDANENKPQD